MKRLLLLAALLPLFLLPATAHAGGLSGGLVGQGSLPGGICSPCPPPPTSQPAIVGGGLVSTTPSATAAAKARDRFERCRKKRGRRICAHGLRPTGPPPHDWLAVAAAYWGVTVTCPPSTVTMVWDEQTLDNTPVGRVFAMAVIGGCWSGQRMIWLNPFFVGYSNRFWCRVVVHEYGHLIGLYHYQSDQYPIMGAGLPNVSVPGCDRAD